MADIFVSYAREDREAIRTLAARLAQTGWTVWWDRHILAGKDFDDVLQAELDKARAVIVVWSAHSVASRWVKVEAGEGLRRELLVPIQLDATLPPLGFRNIQTVSFGGLSLTAETPAFEDLVEALTALLGPPTPASEAPTRLMPQPARRHNTPPPVAPSAPPPVSPEPAVPDRFATPKPDRGSTSRLPLIAGLLVVLAIAAYFALPYLSGRGDRPGDSASPPPASAPAPAKQDTPPTPVPSPPVQRTDAEDPAAAAILTDAALRDFAMKMVDAAASGDAQRVLPYYADRVDYFAMGPVGQDVIRSDKEAYFRRWPEVKFQLTGDISVENGPVPNSRRVKYATAYEVANASRGVKATGTSTTTLVVSVVDGALKIVEQKESVKAARPGS